MQSAKILINLIILLSVLLFPTFSFAQKDENYYRKNPVKAKVKLESCNKILDALAKAGNIKKLEEMLEDSECKAASAVVAEIRKKEAEIEWAKKREKRKLEEAKRKKELAEKKELASKLLPKHYSLFKEIPLEDRTMGNKSPKVKQWKNECENIAFTPFKECDTDIPGAMIYKESFTSYQNDLTLREEKYAECLEYEQKYYAQHKRGIYRFNGKPYSMQGELRGLNECHAVYDVIQKELIANYKAMPLEERVVSQMKCDKSESKYNNLCSQSLKRANREMKAELKDAVKKDEKLKRREFSKFCVIG